MRTSMRYKLMSMEQLFKAYQFENDRSNKEDAATTKKYIVNEVYTRVKKSFDFLEEATSEEEAEKIFKQFIEH